MEASSFKLSSCIFDSWRLCFESSKACVRFAINCADSRAIPLVLPKIPLNHLLAAVASLSLWWSPKYAVPTLVLNYCH
ncbi:hypothetical protein ALC62_01616 [Cyphomyrmex costatus]|uniref:Uncharacterized protein n=1 Tax=Cyphomyrmex costatus TaxID=456900 RepID=A0A195D4Q8_9HYME|nr:hypothetical protein ALC62_01616 [Cyphomyrmex costatus]